MIPCSFSRYSCGYGTCSQSNFSLPFASITLRQDQVASLSLATTVTATATATATEKATSVTNTATPAFATSTCSSFPQGDANPKLIAVGAGVGVPLGIAALAALALFFRERRQSKRLILEKGRMVVEHEEKVLKGIPEMYKPHSPPAAGDDRRSTAWAARAHELDTGE